MIPLRDLLPTRRRPLLTWLLVASNVLAFLYERAMVATYGDAFVVANGFVAARFLADPLGDAGTVATSMFLHAGWLHLLGNMLFLWIFGDNVEDFMGKVRYLAFYFVSGIAAALAQLVIDPGATTPMVGASGAIAGVLGAYLLLYPRARVVTLVPIFVFVQFFELPAWIVIGEWFVLQLVSGFHAVALPGTSGGVAVFAHIGGFLAGLALVRAFGAGRSRPRGPSWPGRARSLAWPAGREHSVAIRAAAGRELYVAIRAATGRGLYVAIHAPAGSV